MKKQNSSLALIEGKEITKELKDREQQNNKLEIIERKEFRNTHIIDFLKY